MPYTDRFEKNINFLTTLDPHKESVSFNSSETLIRQKSSCIWNFFRRVIHYISFKQIPLNKGLDKASEYILKQGLELNNNEITAAQKQLLLSGIGKLETIIKKNDGTAGEKIKRLRLNIQQIQTLEAVQNLGKKDSESKTQPSDRLEKSSLLKED